MNRIDVFSMVCGFLAMTVVALAAMGLGYEGMAFARPWPARAAVAVLVEVVVMRWIGPGPGLLVAALLSPLEKRWPGVGPLQRGLVYLCISATAVGLAFSLLHFFMVR